MNSGPQPGRPSADESARRRPLADWGIEPKDVTLLDRRWAMEWLSDRGLGKALQFIDVTTGEEGDEIRSSSVGGVLLLATSHA